VSPYDVNTSNELTAIPGTTYTYDDNGNTTSKTDSTGTTNYTWDFENRLTSVTLPGTSGTVSLAYDPFGRRIKTVSSAGTSIFAYDDDNLIEETNSSGTVVARYTQGENIDEPLAMLRSGATSYYEQDDLSSVTSLSNGAGSLAQTYTFDSFGNQTASSGSLTNPFRFAGREFDTESSLYFMRARYFDPATGRFISEDPYGKRVSVRRHESLRLYRKQSYQLERSLGAVHLEKRRKASASSAFAGDRQTLEMHRVEDGTQPDRYFNL
jgi:RHS repeat-associated protein